MTDVTVLLWDPDSKGLENVIDQLFLLSPADRAIFSQHLQRNLEQGRPLGCKLAHLLVVLAFSDFVFSGESTPYILEFVREQLRFRELNPISLVHLMRILERTANALNDRSPGYFMVTRCIVDLFFQSL
jgi:hypothetical protein